MKASIIVLCVLFLPFCSCKDAHNNKFVGTWKNKQHDSIEVKIRKEGGELLVATLVRGKVSSTFSYTLKDTTLTPTSQTSKELPILGNIAYVASSGRLSWQGLEWERSN